MVSKGKLVSVKTWYYTKIYYGYRLTDNTRPDLQLVYRKEFFPDGKLRIEGTTLKEKKHGKYKTYYRNGQNQCDCNYKLGQPDSLQLKYFENGQLMLKADYRNGKETGTTTYYFDNGQIWSELLYQDGKPWTVVSNNDRYGNPTEKGTLFNGNGTLYNYAESGRLKSVEYYSQGKCRKTVKKYSGCFTYLIPVCTPATVCVFTNRNCDVIVTPVKSLTWAGYEYFLAMSRAEELL